MREIYLVGARERAREIEGGRGTETGREGDKFREGDRTRYAKQVLVSEHILIPSHLNFYIIYSCDLNLVKTPSYSVLKKEKIHESMGRGLTEGESGEEIIFICR